MKFWSVYKSFDDFMVPTSYSERKGVTETEWWVNYIIFNRNIDKMNNYSHIQSYIFRDKDIINDSESFRKIIKIIFDRS